MRHVNITTQRVQISNKNDVYGTKKNWEQPFSTIKLNMPLKNKKDMEKMVVQKSILKYKTTTATHQTKLSLPQIAQNNLAPQKVTNILKVIYIYDTTTQYLYQKYKNRRNWDWKKSEECNDLPWKTMYLHTI